MLEETGIDYELVPVDIHDESAKADTAFRAASPMGKVPALEDGPARFGDASAICIYLADRYPAAGLAPAVDDPRRGTYLCWMVFTPGVIEPAAAEKRSGTASERHRRGWGDFDTMIETLIAGLGDGPWLLGEQFSAADVMVGASLRYLRQVGELPKRAALDAYVERCLARPAYRRALAIESEALGR